MSKPISNDHFTIERWGDEAHDGPGWYHFDTSYPEEGSVGALKTAVDAFFNAVEQLSPEERKTVKATLAAAREADQLTSSKEPTQ